MAPKKENLPISTEIVPEGGTITYANEVIAIIAGVAANEIEGLAGMCTSGGLGDIINKNRNITRGVKVEVGTEEVSVDLFVVIEYGQPIQKVALEVQENVRKNIEMMTGLHVVRVDVHVQGVSFEKEKREAQQSLKSAQVARLVEETAKETKKETLETKEKEESALKASDEEGDSTSQEPYDKAKKKESKKK